MLCIVSDNPVSRFINGSTVAFVLYATVMAGVFEECGRYIVLKYIMKKNRTRENAILYGIGHGGIEILAVLIPSMISFLVIAVMFSAGDMSAAFSTLGITEENAAAALTSVQTVAAFDYGMMAANVIERILAMLDEYARIAAVQIYNLQCVLDVEAVAIGGGISAREDLIDRIRTQLQAIFDAEAAYQIPPAMPRVVACQFRNDANLIGAWHDNVSR